MDENQNQQKIPEILPSADAPLDKPIPQEKNESNEIHEAHGGKEAGETQLDAPNSNYEAHHIKILAGKDAVRARPGMYIGDTTIRGLHHLVYEAVDNSIDEALAGFCSTILVRIHKEGYISIEDNGRGIPVGIHPEYGENSLTIVLSKLHAGGKFDNKIYKVSGGLHGVGISVANFLSSWFDVWVKRNGKLYYQRFEKGIPVTDVEVRGVSDVTGTRVVFMPDQSIFPDITFHFDVLAKRLRELAFLNSGIKITLYDERLGKEVVFKYDGGLKEFVTYLNANKQPLHPVIYFIKKKDGVELEIGMQYTSAYQETEYTFANNINTQEGGTHLAGFKSALTRVINQYVKEHKMNETLEGDDAREGLTYIISVKLPHPQFEGQTKTKLGNGEILGIVNSLVVEGLGTYLAEHPAEARLIIQKCLEAARAREAARKAKDLVRKGALEGGSLPGKLADCSSRDPSKSEVFIVEGDSAGGCFSGDTKVALVDGRALSFRDIVDEDKAGKKNFCYTIKEDGSVGIEEIKNPCMTQKKAEIVKVILDNNEEILCTPNHLFMLRDGHYKPALQLAPGDSLMPLQRQFSRKGRLITIEGYEMVHNPIDGRWIFTHMLADEWNITHQIYTQNTGEHRHHSDFNKLNNNPTNLQRFHRDEHLQLHRELAAFTLHTPATKEKCRALRQQKEFRTFMSNRMKEPQTRAVLSQNARRQWENPHYKDYMAKKCRYFYVSNEAYRKNVLERLHQEQKEYWDNEHHKKEQSRRTKEFFASHPEQRLVLSQLSDKQWDNPLLRAWRAEKTREQWTDEFRLKRKESYNKTYYRKTLVALREVYDKNGTLDVTLYNDLRKNKRDKTLLRFDTFLQRFFHGNISSAEEAVKNYNHKVVQVVLMDEKQDVYDIEVPFTHNFALASGVFVHNSAKQGRNREFQAVLPLRGKILNVEKARLHKVFENVEICALITAIGTGVNEEFDLSEARYHKVIIATDADVDGSHIRTLLLTFFYRYMKKLIEAGYVYIAQPPLYKIQRGKAIQYAHTDREKEGILKAFGEGGVSIQRYKGLGEMNPEQLGDTTMDPEQRVLKQVCVEDAVEADRIFTLLMGEEVEPRRAFIMENAKDVVNLDV